MSSVACKYGGWNGCRLISMLLSSPSLVSISLSICSIHTSPLFYPLSITSLSVLSLIYFSPSLSLSLSLSFSHSLFCTKSPLPPPIYFVKAPKRKLSCFPLFSTLFTYSVRPSVCLSVRHVCLPICAVHLFIGLFVNLFVCPFALFLNTLHFSRVGRKFDKGKMEKHFW